MCTFFAAAALTGAFNQRYAQSGVVDLQAGAAKTKAVDPNFGATPADEKIDLQAAGVLSFNSAGKIVTCKALSHFGVLGTTVIEGSVLELPESDFKRMGPNGTGQVRKATDEEVAAAQAAKK